MTGILTYWSDWGDHNLKVASRTVIDFTAGAYKAIGTMFVFFVPLKSQVTGTTGDIVLFNYCVHIV
jgi:hypothetical protein